MFTDEFIFDLQRFKEISNENDSTVISGTSSADTISNAGNLVTIKGGNGNDSIYSSTHSNSSLATDYNPYGYGYVTIDAGAGNDTVYSNDPYISINGGAGNDSIYHPGNDYVTMSGGTGNDTIYSNYGPYNLFKYAEGDGNDLIQGFDSSSTLSIAGGSYSTQTSGDNVIVKVGTGKITLEGAATLGSSLNIKFKKTGVTLSSSADNTSLIGGSGNDSLYIQNYGVTASGGAGTDSIYNIGFDAKINAGDGNDYIYSYWGSFSTINAGDGNDTVDIYGSGYESINGGAGNDLITLGGSSGFTKTVKGGTGNDTIYHDAKHYLLYQYTSGDGNDIIYDWNSNDTLEVGGGTGTYSTQQSGDDIIVTVGDGKITLQGATYYTLNIDGVYSGGGSKFITLTEGNDTYENTVEGATINALGGNDTIYNIYYSNVSIDAGKGNDYIYNTSWYSNISLNGGAGNDTLYVQSDGGKTLTGGTGSDLFSFYYDSDTLYGTDVITDYAEEDTIQFNNVAVTKISKSGNNIIFKAGDNKLTVKNAANKVITYIDSDGTTKTYPDEDNTWTISGTTAKYGTSGNTLITVKGVKNLDGLSLSGNVVTVSKDSLNKKKVTISGDGYTLKLGSDVDKPTTKKAAWSYKNGTATYKSSYKTAGYKLASNSKSITYSKATTAETLATVKGVKSKDGLSVSGKVVTVSEASVNAKKITISGNGYTLKLADGLAPSSKKAAWTYKNGTATYKSSSNTAGYKLASNSKSITYSAATTASTLATVKGAKSKSGLSVSGKKITLKNSALSNKVTVSGSYEFDFAKDYGTATITGSSNADTITTRGSKISVNGGKGDDTIKILGTTTTVKGGNGADIFIYNSGKNVIADYAAEDKISIASGTAATSTSGDDLILTVGSGKILTVKGGANETVTYFDSDGEHVYKKSSANVKIITLNGDYDKATYSMGDKLRTLDASAVPLDIKITGNNLMNSIVGGAGNDTLIGGDGNDTLTGGGGADVFVWNKGDDNDLITDYNAEEDTILIKGSTVSKKTAKSKDVIFTLASKDKITVQGGAYKVIDYTDDKGSYSYSHFVTFKGKSATLKDDYGKNYFNADDYSDDLAKINAKNVTHGLNIVGNDNANSIFGTAHEDTIDGGASNDTLHGGDGNDSLKGGNGKDYIYGGDGNDTLWGGAGNDYLEGGAGSDIFIYKPGEGTDTISGYKYDTDTGELDTIMIPGGQGVNVNVSGDNGNFTIKIGSGTIILENSPGGKFARIVDENNNNLNPNRS